MTADAAGDDAASARTADAQSIDDKQAKRNAVTRPSCQRRIAILLDTDLRMLRRTLRANHPRSSQAAQSAEWDAHRGARRRRDRRYSLCRRRARWKRRPGHASAAL